MEYVRKVVGEIMAEPICATGFYSRVDGIASTNPRLLRLGRLCAGTEVSSDPLWLRRIRHEFSHSKSIGFLVESCSALESPWCQWWDLPEPCWGWARLISRGAKWTFSDWNGKVRDGDQFEDLMRKHLPAHVFSFRGLNFCRRSVFAKFVRSIQSAGFMLRKEDHGSRYVFVPVTVERRWMKLEQKKRGLVGVRPVREWSKDFSPAKLYFLPKMHKSLVSGRCIESCGKLEGISAVSRFNEKFPYSCGNLASMTNTLANAFVPDASFLVGDIVTMYPSIPRDELLLLLKNELGPKYSSMVAKWLRSHRCSWDNRVFRLSSGLPIGHSWSAPLALFYLNCKEKSFVDWAVGCGVTFCRYVDDGGFILPPSISEELLQSHYEKSVSPLLVEWKSNPRRILDVSLSKKGFKQWHSGDQNKRWIRKPLASGGSGPVRRIMSAKSLLHRFSEIHDAFCDDADSMGDIAFEDLLNLEREFQERGDGSVIEISRRSLAPSKALSDNVVLLRWLPWLETRTGKRIWKKFRKLLVDKEGKLLRLRWIPQVVWNMDRCCRQVVGGDAVGRLMRPSGVG